MSSPRSVAIVEENNTHHYQQQQQQLLPEEVERDIDCFLAKVERHEFRPDESNGNSAQLQCAIEAVDLYARAFQNLPDDVDQYWQILVGVTSRLQSAPALRMLFSNIGKRVQRHWMEAITSCQDFSNSNMLSPSTTNAAAFPSRPFAGMSSTISCLQIDEMHLGDEIVPVGGGGAGGQPQISPSTAALGQFPNMQRIPTSSLLFADGDARTMTGGTGDFGASASFATFGGTGRGGGAGGGGHHHHGGGAAAGVGFVITEAIENIAMMTPAARGTHVFRRNNTAASSSTGTGTAQPSHPQQQQQPQRSGSGTSTTTGYDGPSGGGGMTGQRTTSIASNGTATSAFAQYTPYGGSNKNNNNNAGGGGMNAPQNSSITSMPTGVSVGGMSTTTPGGGPHSANSSNTARPRRRYIPVVGAEEAVQVALESLKDDLRSVTTRISDQAPHHINHDECVLAFGCTNTLASFFKQAASSGARFKVLLIETASGLGGRSALQPERNMSVERVCMSNCYAIMSRVSKVFLSCEAVFANGGLVAFAGSHAVCLAAKLCTIPVICVVASIKFSESFPSDSAGSTLIKVDQHRSVEWREFLPPSDILPPEYGSASDAFDCLDSSSSSSSSSSCEEAEDEDEDEQEHQQQRRNKTHQQHQQQQQQPHTPNADGPLNTSDTTQAPPSSLALKVGSGDAAGPNDTSGFSATFNSSSLGAGGVIGNGVGGVNGGSGGVVIGGVTRGERAAAVSALREKLRRTRKLPPVQVWNPLNEYVPPDCVSIFVTELYEITPALVQVFVDSLNEPKLYS